MLLGWTETKLWTLKYGLKSIQTSLILRKRPPKPYKLLKIFYQFCDNCKTLSCTFHLKEDEIKIAMFAHFKEYHGNQNILRIYMIVGGRCLKLKTFVWIFNHISRSITWSLFILKASYLVKWPISTWSFIWRCQFIDYLKFWNSPQFPDEFRNG